MISNVRGWNQLPRWCGALIALVLFLAVGNAGGIPLARAAPDSAETVSYSVFAYPTQFEIRNCPKAKQEIYVGVRRTVTKVISGKSYEMTGGTVNGIDIKVKTKPSNGSVSPNDATVTSMDRTGTFQTVFIYDPEKAGKDTITFSSTGSQSDELLAPLVPPADATVQVKILPCKYKTKLNYRTQIPGNERPGYFTEYASMEEVLLEPDENGHFKAAGSYRLHGFDTVNIECPMTWFGSDLQVDIAGDVGQDVVNLAFDFVLAEVTGNFACAGSFVSAAHYVGERSTVIPTAGGVTNIVGLLEGYPISSVVITVIVQPEAEQPAVSRTDHPVAWLPDWFETAFLLPGESR
jgi:hypothetical protein